MSSGNLMKESHINDNAKESAPAGAHGFSLPEDEQRPQEADRDEDEAEQ